jgi:ABC-type multidrug transport system ATPase subunit
VFCGACGAQIIPAAPASDYDFEAETLTVVRGGRTILDNASFVVPPRSLVAVIGPSGAGKTTLLGALTGTAPADTGTVRYAGHDLYTEYETMRHAIGLVPQQDLLHPTLTVDAALDYGAQLRFPSQVTAEQRWRRIDHVLEQLQIGGRRTLRVDQLSGGQRKRTSVAMELLTAPTLLFLDEPTSGLDPGLDAKIMRLLHGLAKDPEANRTVFVVTHNVSNLGMCDFIVVMAPGGKVAYFGAPGVCADAFHAPDLPAVFEQFEDDPAAVHRMAETVLRTQVHELNRRAPTRRPAVVAAPPHVATLRQWAVLVRRQLAVMASDRKVAGLLVGLPLVLGLLGAAIGTDNGLGRTADGQPGNPYAQAVLVVLMISVILLGLANTITEIAGETAIYRREQAMGVDRTAYLCAKSSVLVSVTLLQCAVVVALTLMGRPGPAQPAVMGSYGSVLVPLLALGGACALIGLSLSALLGSRERAMNALVGAVIVLIVFSGAFVLRFDSAVIDVLQRAVPSSWSYNALAAATDLQALSPMPDPPPEWGPTAANWYEGVAGTMVFWVAAFASAWVFLARVEPRRRRA